MWIQIFLFFSIQFFLENVGVDIYIEISLYFREFMMPFKNDLRITDHKITKKNLRQKTIKTVSQ